MDTEKALWNIFNNINCWLKYAERKNAYILTILALQLTIMKFISCTMNIWLLISLVLIGLSFILCIFSFFPKTVISSWMYWLAKNAHKPNANDNLLFYGHIVKYSIGEYINKIECYFNVKLETNKYLKDICGQIVINAGITDAKYKFFKFNFFLMLFGQLFFILSYIR